LLDAAVATTRPGSVSLASRKVATGGGAARAISRMIVSAITPGPLGMGG
jgi:hypothetical protein